MLNDETRRKLRLLNVGEFIEELEIQQQDPQTLALPFDDRFQLLTDGEKESVLEFSARTGGGARSGSNGCSRGGRTQVLNAARKDESRRKRL